jgi:hypothetical protein
MDLSQIVVHMVRGGIVNFTSGILTKGKLSHWIMTLRFQKMKINVPYLLRISMDAFVLTVLVITLFGKGNHKF